MRREDGPDHDVRGHMLLCSDRGSDQFDFRARCYPDGHATVDADGVTYYVPAEMTAVEYLRMMFSRRIAPPGSRQSVGAMVAMCVLGLIAAAT
jgi:hypothetical protein